MQTDGPILLRSHTSRHPLQHFWFDKQAGDGTGIDMDTPVKNEMDYEMDMWIILEYDILSNWHCSNPDNILPALPPKIKRLLTVSQVK